ncbi:hypothetical protein [Methylobacterium flocculans]|uniref:hypothetical protein n=1 Tax=Methylobacterium flocculans TaxID=2984843 RepID=UPI0021F29182|nr:hypothetical protein [Methylobacterium sp. FF17]
MTADLREAFHTAAVKLLGWRRSNERQGQWGVVYSETGRREYDPEPTVCFFGRDYSLTEICDLAGVLEGALPPHMQALFLILDDHVGEPIPRTYPEAVEALSGFIEAEGDLQELYPLTDLPLVEKLRADSFQAGAAAVLDLATMKAGAS